MPAFFGYYLFHWLFICIFHQYDKEEQINSGIYANACHRIIRLKKAFCQPVEPDPGHTGVGIETVLHRRHSAHVWYWFNLEKTVDR